MIQNICALLIKVTEIQIAMQLIYQGYLSFSETVLDEIYAVLHFQEVFELQVYNYYILVHVGVSSSIFV